VPVFDPPETDNLLAKRHILENLAHWAEVAVAQTTPQR
jgi:hypothetical protein